MVMTEMGHLGWCGSTYGGHNEPVATIGLIFFLRIWKSELAVHSGDLLNGWRSVSASIVSFRPSRAAAGLERPEPNGTERAAFAQNFPSA